MAAYDIPSLRKLISLKLQNPQNETSIDLTIPNNLGITPTFLACRNDDCHTLKLLANRGGVDLTEPCDVTQFGTILFYAVYFRKRKIIEALWELGYDLERMPCDKFGRGALYYAERRDDGELLAFLREVIGRGSVWDFMAVLIGKVVRGFLVRKRMRVVRG
mmetsp:Transcript_53428/g.64401  ORF Transcript_53428/g.64401 Transcript_53428/m.64401 type:complete len:161 (+) Transcript_53428:233-715(+)